MHYALVQRQPGFVDFRLASQRYAFDNSAILAAEAASKPATAKRLQARRRASDWTAIFKARPGHKPALA